MAIEEILSWFGDDAFSREWVRPKTEILEEGEGGNTGRGNKRKKKVKFRLTKSWTRKLWGAKGPGSQKPFGTGMGAAGRFFFFLGFFLGGGKRGGGNEPSSTPPGL